MKKQKSAKLAIAKKMPPLFHTLPGQPFNICKSEVAKWLISQPDILQYIFDKSREYLEYNSFTGEWQGINYD